MSISRKLFSSLQANLRACNQDLRNHVTELKRELELQKTALMRVEREKDDVVQKVKQQIEVEKNKELEKMKQSVVKQILALEYNGYSVHKPNNQMQYNKKLVSTSH